MITRFSSRRQRLDHSFLRERLQGAQSYDRIAGFFSSSILEVAGEAFEALAGPVRLVCNSGLDPQDVATARKAAQAAMRREWCDTEPERLSESARPRFQRLYEFLVAGKLQVRVVPDAHFGLIHGKAGVITLADGRQTAFLGSVNESMTAWRLNYELLWEDDSEDAVCWVQEEFDALWHSPFAVALAEAVVQDIGRLAKRSVIPNLSDWRDHPDPAAPVIESPVYRKEVGLWEHQKHFVKLAFEAHLGPHGARLVLADQVGLGKTIQLAMAAQLMALSGDRPVLILAPKPLIWQWQGELSTLLDMPSAVWDGRNWIDENGIEHPSAGPESVRKCPRRVGIVSTGLIIAGSEIRDWLVNGRYECVILDEAHRARRRNLAAGKEYEAAEPNNLLRFLWEISPRTKSLLLATATPVQIHPVEAWDLLDALARGSEAVLGGVGSLWRKPRQALELLLGEAVPPDDVVTQWAWMRNPLPPAAEGPDYQSLRRVLRLTDQEVSAPGGSFERLSAPDRARVRRLFPRFVEQANPFIRRIVLRTREYLETTLDPETGEPFLKPVQVRLHGDRDEDAIVLPPFLEDAYHLAEAFCSLLAERARSGFFRTLLLRRVGSTMEAGRRTVEKLLAEWTTLDEDEEDDGSLAQLRTLTPAERALLQRFLKALEANQERDPKYQIVRSQLLDQGWMELGCIIFSQYFDSVFWLASQLTADIPEEEIGIYAGARRSGVMHNGIFTAAARDLLKERVRRGEIRILIGTDAASEGLNLQRLGTLINLDLPWNPSRLEQRKGRIQRIGQLRDTVDLYNLRYAGSVEDRVHELLSSRLENIATLFGQIPDILEDVWVDVALGQINAALKTIDAVPRKHPFQLRYQGVEKVDWEGCAEVLSAEERKRFLTRGWGE
ncbi:helicase SNF2 [Thiorhodococcus mannitoliphagus]|uniref:Helicase SNF2 n=1 Tax=Thiorhodococcus mannitoliphagus TaxID=329406 RepID=A0A6P1DQW1_9GAMM|nr:phospholipase D-like domain-containing anti-phage protein [Thiorhodococcus mannitoliphagus]NEX19066.1 helicase SNF2 [Thiorhodococcus mannitoliphagus]